MTSASQEKAAAMQAREVKAAPYTREQLVVALETVASHLVTINNLLMLVQSHAQTSHEAGVMLDAAQAMVASTGVMADAVSGAGIYGAPDHWNFGAAFVEAGKAGVA